MAKWLPDDDDRDHRGLYELLRRHAYTLAGRPADYREDPDLEDHQIESLDGFRFRVAPKTKPIDFGPHERRQLRQLEGLARDSAKRLSEALEELEAARAWAKQVLARHPWDGCLLCRTADNVQAEGADLEKRVFQWLKERLPSKD